LPVGVLVGGLLAAVFAATGSDPRRAILPIVAVLALAFFLRTALRERALRQQGLGPTGEVEAAWFTDDGVRNRRNINGAVLTTVLVVAGVVLLSIRGD
jgi:hypothetical protein